MGRYPGNTIDETPLRAYTYINNGVFVWIRCGITHTAVIIEHTRSTLNSYFLYPEYRQVECGSDLGSLFTIALKSIELTKDTIPDDVRPYLIHALMSHTDGRKK